MSLKYASPESLSLFMYQNPKRAKKLYKEIVPKAVDEYLDCIEKSKKKYKNPNNEEKKAFLNLIKMLENSPDNLEPEDIQTNIYTIGKENGYKENLRDWFRLIYEVVFGVENGPRLGFFISFFGVKNTIKLIKEKIN